MTPSQAPITTKPSLSPHISLSMSPSQSPMTTKPSSIPSQAPITKNTSSVSFISPEEKGSCKMVDASNVAELVDLLHNEAKII